MKSGFSDPIAIKHQFPKDKPQGRPEDSGSIAWDHRCPQYDERSSCFVSAGTNYGKGHRQPVGREGNPKSKVDVLPYGRVKTMQVSYYE